jgi:hypothetical protein
MIYPHVIRTLQHQAESPLDRLEAELGPRP